MNRQRPHMWQVCLFLIGLAGLLTVGSTLSLYGQELLPESKGKIRLLPDNSSGELPAQIFFGFGPQYTDTTDQGEVEIPFLPPQNYYVWLRRPCDGPFAGDPCRWQEDYRGIPDSLENGSVDQFTLEFLIGLYNTTGGLLRMTILNPDWPENVDSINFVDPIVPTAFNKTITGPTTFVIENEFVNRITMTVYYNFSVSAVEEERAVRSNQNIQIIPNPVTKDYIRLAGDLDQGDNVEVVNMMGEVLVTTNVSEPTSQLEIEQGLSEGIYFLVHRNSQGEVKGRQLLRIAH